MKKILFLIIALVLVFGTMALAADNSTTGSNLEKISSPAEIKNFGNIKKIGTELWGIRKRVMEKINSLQDLENFEAVKKIGNNLWGIRKIDSQALITPEAATCVKTAIDKKDTAIKDALSNVSSNLANLLDQRNICQKTALDKTTIKEQKEANNICINNFKKDMLDGRKTLREAHKNIWDTYKTDLKACEKLQPKASALPIRFDDGGFGFDL